MNIVNKYFKLFSTIQMMGLSHKKTYTGYCKMSFHHFRKRSV